MAYTIGKFILWVLGWTVHPNIPPGRCVCIGVPHTSNWDGIIGLSAAAALRLRLRFLAKDSLFWPPLGWLLRAMGGIPLDRSHKHGLVEQAASWFTDSDELRLALAPEGTRSRSRYWKSGFYQIARAANVPVALGFVDYGTKTAGFGPALELTGDMERDMESIRKFYADKTGKNPADFGEIRFRPKTDG